MHDRLELGPSEHQGFWMDTYTHQTWLRNEAARQFSFFRKSLRPEGGFYQLDPLGKPLPRAEQELFATTRMIHSFSLGALFGFDGCEPMIEHGMKFLINHHQDPQFGGFVWSLRDDKVCSGKKLAYGHAFVLLAAASALQAGHPDALNLLETTTYVLLERFWNEERGVFADEANRDWTPFSSYRGFNSNMHATEALLTAYEATKQDHYLEMAGRILDFFVHTVAVGNDHRIPEHFNKDWSVDYGYAGDPMFRPAGTTPGHSFELARLLLQHWDLSGRKNNEIPIIARRLVERALLDSWDAENGGFYYTLKIDGTPDVRSRYWWPVTEAIGVIAVLIKLERRKIDELWYRNLWEFADSHFIDHENGGWYPEIDGSGRRTYKQFKGKPDIYHSIQAALFPLSDRMSDMHSNEGAS